MVWCRASIQSLRTQARFSWFKIKLPSFNRGGGVILSLGVIQRVNLNISFADSISSIFIFQYSLLEVAIVRLQIFTSEERSS